MKFISLYIAPLNISQDTNHFKKLIIQIYTFGGIVSGIQRSWMVLDGIKLDSH